MIDKINPIKFNPKLLEANNVDSKQQKKGVSFEDVLKKAVDEVNSYQKNAEKLSADYAAGKTDNINDVIIAAEKADISLRLTIDVRNKIVDAFKEIMRMQI
jgi:flagellar hook-basal body complex protein FliE